MTIPWPNGPSKDDLLMASVMGHDPDVLSVTCSCGWTVNYRSGLLGSGQLANHIWTVVHEAKEGRALRMGDKLCIVCKGSGVELLLNVPCRECRGLGVKTDYAERARLKYIAVDLGHEPDAKGKCVCDLQGEGSWERHAVEVALAALRELEQFEEQLRHG